MCDYICGTRMDKAYHDRCGQSSQVLSQKSSPRCHRNRTFQHLQNQLFCLAGGTSDFPTNNTWRAFFLWLVCFPSFNSSIYRSLQNTSFWICLGVATQYIYILYNMYISMGLSNKPQKMAILGPWNHGEFSLAAMAVGDFHSGATPLSLDVWEWKFPLEWMISY